MIGILGGTFDPVHFGHLRPVLEIQQALGLEEIRLVPCNLPPHRPQPQASREQRLEMLQAAVSGHSAFRIDTREFDRDGPSYMLDTLKSLRAESKDAGLCLILGMDAFLGLPGWHRWRELLEYAHIVVMTRPGSALPREGELTEYIDRHMVRDAERLQAVSQGLLWFHAVTRLDISATQIRSLVALDLDPGFLTPQSVIEIISREGLYATGRHNDN